MASTILRPLEISSPGRDPFCMIGVDKLRINGDVLFGTPDISVIDQPTIMFDDIQANSSAVEIGGLTFPAGTAILFTMIVPAGIPDGDYLVAIHAESNAGYEADAQKPLKIRPILSR